MRFEQRLRDGIHAGAIVLAFRRWKRSQVVPGRRYRTGIDLVEVESVDVVEPSSVDASQAREAGYASVGELLADLRGDPALPVYRIRLRRIDGPDPRNELARADSLTKADVAAITARLARIDRSSSRGPWTAAVLALIADRPGIVSTVLAEAMGWERQDFKLHVRRLKELGLTLSLDVGYQLSPRGESYLNHLAGGDAGAGQLEALFTEQREAERAEFTADCGKYEAELAGEVAKGKLTLAELDEEEESLERLRRWYRSIRARDVFGAPSASDAERRLKECADALERFAEQVYQARERP